MNSPARAAPLSVVLIGATGRMGRAILAARGEFPQLTLVAAIASATSAALGKDSGVLAGGAANHVPVTGNLAAALSQAAVVIDFSAAAATAANLAACVAAGKPLLIGSTGFAPELEADFAAAARRIALLVAPNTSLGVALLLEFAQAAAVALPGFTIDIRERHHAAKRDAPSGTALALAAAAGAASRAASGAAPVPHIPISSVREGTVVGEHTVHLAGAGEELFLSHHATDRAVFARGALAAAVWLASRPPGRYAMRDLLDVKTVT